MKPAGRRTPHNRDLCRFVSGKLVRSRGFEKNCSQPYGTSRFCRKILEAGFLHVSIFIQRVFRDSDKETS